MNPGRELDALIAEKVMNLKEPLDDYREYRRLEATINSGMLSMDMLRASKLLMKYNDGISIGIFFPYYSTDISAAFQVIEKLKLWIWPYKGKWVCGQADDEQYFDPSAGVIDGMYCGVSMADTAPHAICLAALKVVEGK